MPPTWTPSRAGRPADDPRLAGCPDWMRGVHEDQVRYFSR